MTENLNTEIETYNSKLPELLKSIGKYVVIKDETVGGVFDTYNDALKYAYKEYGLNQFFIKKISPAEQVSYFTRDFNTCQA